MKCVGAALTTARLPPAPSGTIALFARVCPARKLIVETDGRRHRTRAAFERDRARDALLTAVGWRVMRFTTRQVRGDPATVAARVLSARSRLLATP